MFEVDMQQGVAVLRIAHGRANAMDLELLLGLDARLAELAAGPARALVITGQANMFCAGVDLPRLVAEGEAHVEAFLEALVGTLLRLYGLPLPVVGAVNGHAIAGGCLLAVACDHAIAADGKGKMGVTELRVGVPFPPLGLEILRAAVAPNVARELVYTGRLVGMQEAAKLGLVQEVVPESELMTRAVAIATQFAAVPRATFAITKRAMRLPVLDRVEREFAAIDREVRDTWRSPEVRDAIKAFIAANIGKR